MDTSLHPGANYPYYNQPSSTPPRDLGVSVDDGILARQKRKRTSPEDSALLETAYKRDAKPDKVARLELVKQVSLGEKEIWFQNRRQSSRRKSRPLLPHEIAQYQMSRLGASSVDGSSLGESEATSFDAVERDELRNAQPSVATAQASGSGFQSFAEPTAAYTLPGDSSSRMAARGDHVVSIVGPAGVAWERSAQPSAAPTTEQLKHLFNAERYNVPPPSLSRPQTNGVSPAQPVPNADTRGRLKKSSSCVRLSMSIDGNASIVTKDGSSPSPPRPPPVLYPSAEGASDRPGLALPVARASVISARDNLQRTTSGRSRDSRAWEFWCDKDTRSELEVKADNESSGSAAGAIGLLRSASGRSILGSLPAKRNAGFSDKGPEPKRSKLESKRPPLQRANTSFGRLQGKSKEGLHGYTRSKPSLKQSSSSISVYIPGNDSDKENWSPESEQPLGGVKKSVDIRSTKPSVKKAVLGQSRSAGNAMAARSRNQAPTKEAARREQDSENADPEVDDEVASFMRGEQQRKSTSSEEDLDCVQGLLSLSQGNWRC